MTESHKYTNRLIYEKSPYLLQHAHNPVNWYPWGEEAFSEAKNQGKPIFLSIGYATCHWCHVMEKESFENEEIAFLLNDAFINIKIDREELPEIDLIYMEFAQSMMSGAGGWPLNVILTPELEPFFATTYVPPYARYGMMGLVDLIERIKEIWIGEEREIVLAQAKKIVEVFNQNVHTQGSELPESEYIEATSELLIRLADPVYGGMKGAPKFPIGYQMNFLLREAKFSNDSRSIFLVERTLEMMHRGGIYDHVGGGFSRYSTDERWLVPHFEKMLYDNALLIHSYQEAWQATKKPIMKVVAESIINYLRRDMLHPEGGFYSAEDADTEGREGLFYTWRYDEIIEILGNHESELFREYYHITPKGNFEGRNILNTTQNLEEFANQKKMDFEEVNKLFQNQINLLLSVRNKRIRPIRDEKILTSWNGLMIFSLAEAGKAFQNQEYIHLANLTANFIKKNMWDGSRLLRRWCDGEALYEAGLDDYAFLIRGLISLFEVEENVEWLDWALLLTDYLETNFKSEDGAFFHTEENLPNLIIRKCQFADGAEPSGNAIHSENLLRLYQITGNQKFLDQAEDVFKATKKLIETYSPGYCYHMISLLRYYDKNRPTIVIALNKNQEHHYDLLKEIYTRFIPHKTVVVRKENDEHLFKTLPYVVDQIPYNGKTTLYICLHGICERPITHFEEMLKAIAEL